MKKEILIFIANGYADWEIAYICPQINGASTDYIISTVAQTSDAVLSMGGLKVTPDYSLAELLEKNAKLIDVEMLLLCGGIVWRDCGYIFPEVEQLVDIAIDEKVLISAICDATTYLAYNNYLNYINHTGNSVEYIISQCPEYSGESNFIEKQCVCDGGIVTANGSAALQFAREILKQLNVKTNEEIDDWYNFNKEGYYNI